MSTLVIYYSFTGNTERLAKKFADDESADLVRLKDKTKTGKPKAFLVGCPLAIAGKSWPVQPLKANVFSYDRVVLMAPVWAGNVPPAVNSLWDMLPAGTALEVRLVSGSGKSECRERLEKNLKAKGCRLVGLKDIKASDDDDD